MTAIPTAQGQETIVDMSWDTYLAQLRHLVEAGRARRDPTLAIAVSLGALGRLLDSIDHAGHRTAFPHDCFVANCRDLGTELLEQIAERQGYQDAVAGVVAYLVASAGGRIDVPENIRLGDPPEILISDDRVAGVTTYRTRDRKLAEAR